MIDHNIIRLIALSTTDEMIAKWLQQELQESPAESAAQLSKTCWGNDIGSTDLEQTKVFLRRSLEREVFP